MRYVQKIQETGRSMIEMLGVLAIVGILSVGGIIGFDKALRTWRLNNAVDEFLLFIRELMHYHDDWIKRAHALSCSVALTPVVAKVGILPSGWKVMKTRIMDSTNHVITVVARCVEITVNYEIRNKDYGKRSDKDVKEYCRLLVTRGAVPYADSLKRLRIHRYGEGEGTGASWTFYGSKYCPSGQQCLHNAKMADILRFCEICEDYENCTLVFVFE